MGSDRHVRFGNELRARRTKQLTSMFVFGIHTPKHFMEASSPVTQEEADELMCLIIDKMAHFKKQRKAKQTA